MISHEFRIYSRLFCFSPFTSIGQEVFTKQPLYLRSCAKHCGGCGDQLTCSSFKLKFLLGDKT